MLGTEPLTTVFSGTAHWSQKTKSVEPVVWLGTCGSSHGREGGGQDTLKWSPLRTDMQPAVWGSSSLHLVCASPYTSGREAAFFITPGETEAWAGAWEGPVATGGRSRVPAEAFSL